MNTSDRFWFPVGGRFFLFVPSLYLTIIFSSSHNTHAGAGKVRRAAVGVLTRRELATDEIAAHACCNLLEDADPRLRREVLARLGRLMKESR